MSTRQMAQRYSSRGGGGGGLGLLAEADIFGLGRKRRLREMEDAAKYEKDLTQFEEQQKRETARQAQANSILHAKGIIPNDRNLSDYDTATRDALIRTAAIVAESGRSAAETKKSYIESDRGRKVLQTGLEGELLEPAFKTAKLGERRLGMGDTGQFFDPMDLFTGQPTIGRGATPAEFDTKMVLDPKGKPTTQTVQTRGMTPGYFGAGVLNPAIKAQAANIGGPGQAPTPAPALTTGVQPEAAPFRGIIPSAISGIKSLQTEAQPYMSFFRHPGAYYKNMLQDLLFGRDRERDASLMLELYGSDYGTK